MSTTQAHELGNRYRSGVSPWILVSGMLLVVLAFVGWRENRTTHTVMCVRCRLQGHVEKLGSFQIYLTTVPNACSEWYPTSLGAHEHAWRTSGCTFSTHGLSTMAACPANLPPLLEVTPEQQMGALQSFSGEQRDQFFRLAESKDRADQERALAMVNDVLSHL